MTTEEKARKYDDAINRARKLKESPEEVFLEFSPNDGETVCDYIFPELSHKNKTDDEKILDGLISFFEDCSYELIGEDALEVQDVVSWLKFQEQKQKMWFKNTKDNKPAFSHSVIMMTSHGIAEGEWMGDCWLQYRWSSKLKDEEVLFWTECSSLEKTIPDDVCVHQSEDFNEGDWVTDGNKNLYVSGKSDNAYVVLSENGTLGCITFDSVWKYHKWTVKDARRGDILVDNADGLPFILRRKNKSGALLPYCGIVNNDVFRFMDDWPMEDWSVADCNGSFVDVSPADNEQRQRILDALDKAGYTYDDVNKDVIKKKT